MRLSRTLWLVAGLLLLLSTSAVAVPTPTHVHFTAAGDVGSSSNVGPVLDGVKDSGTDAHFALGDLSYGTTGTESTWCDLVKSRLGEGFPFELLAGNHESNGQNGNINDFSACLPNQLPGVSGTYGRQYYVDMPQSSPLVRFIMISPALTFPDGTWDYSAGSARYSWTAKAIDDARAAGVKWVVVGMHKPCLSVGEMSCDPGPDLTNLLLSKRVDLVLSGHEHSYQRTKQLSLGTGCTTLTIGGYDADCVADSDNDLVAGAGTVFLTIGTGGVDPHNIVPTDPEAGYFSAMAGANQNPVWGFGDFDATPTSLSMRFARTGGSSFTDGFTLTKPTDPPPNQAPTASFSSQVTGLQTSLDGSGSTDPDGVVASYAWDFGDGQRGTGASAQHTYAQAGTYPVSLTVTDDRGATATRTSSVTVTAPTPPPATTVVAADTFERTVTDGWGTADTGGPWTVSTVAGVASVGGGKGRTVLGAPSTSRSSTLTTVSSTSNDMLLDLALDKLPTGSGSSVYHSSLVRRIDGNNYYRGMVRVLSTGVVRASLHRMVGGTGLQLGDEVSVPGVTYARGDVLKVRVQATGTSPTALRLRVWKAGTPEPTTWLLSTTDASAALQAPGRVGMISYLPSSVTNAPIQATYDNLQVTAVP
jgi:PKD repeat protein